MAIPKEPPINPKPIIATLRNIYSSRPNKGAKAFSSHIKFLKVCGFKHCGPSQKPLQADDVPQSIDHQPPRPKPL